MDVLNRNFSYLNIKNSIYYGILSHNIVNKQKCYVPLILLNDLQLKCLDIVTVEINNKSYICKVYTSLYDVSNFIKFTPTVSFVTGLLNNRSSSKISKVDKVMHYINIEVQFVVEDYESTFISPNLVRKLLVDLILHPQSTVDLVDLQFPVVKSISQIIILDCKPSTFGIITAKTQISVKKCLSIKHLKQQNFNQLYFGMKSQLNELLELIQINVHYKSEKLNTFKPFNQILLAGASGCGKTALVQKVASLSNLMIVNICGDNVYKRDPGEAEKSLSKLFDDAFSYSQCNGGCIILIEDIESLCPSHRNMSQHTRRLSTCLMHLLDQCASGEYSVFVVATTNNPSDINPTLRRHGRLAKEIYFPKQSKSERQEIVSGYLQHWFQDTDVPINELSANIADVTQGYVAADLKDICYSIKMKYKLAKNRNINNLLMIVKQVVLTSKPLVIRGDLDIVTPGQNVDEIGGMEYVKKQLQLILDCMFVFPDVYKRLGLSRTKGVLLYGPPGCAKTTLVKSLAAKGNVTVLCATSASIYSPYVGDAEKAIVCLFEKARQNAPSIIFLDEIDSIIGSRSHSNSTDVQGRVLSALLTEMDGIGITMKVADYNKTDADGDDVLVIAATNRPTEIDPALLRPGRFDKHIYVPPPDLETRTKILQVITQNTPLDPDVDLGKIALRLENCSGADIKNLHTEVVLRAMVEDGVQVPLIKQTHYDAVLKDFKSSLDSATLAKYEKLL